MHTFGLVTNVVSHVILRRRVFDQSCYPYRCLTEAGQRHAETVRNLSVLYADGGGGCELQHEGCEPLFDFLFSGVTHVLRR